MLLRLVVCPVTVLRESLLTEQNSNNLSQSFKKLIPLSISQIHIQIFIAMQSADGKK